MVFDVNMMICRVICRVGLVMRLMIIIIILLVVRVRILIEFAPASEPRVSFGTFEDVGLHRDVDFDVFVFVFVFVSVVGVVSF